MIHKFISLIIVCILLVACKSGINPDEKLDAVEQELEKEKFFSGINLDTLKGVYEGDFGDAPIRIVLTYLSPKHAVGYNIHRGLLRNISGTLEESENEVKLILNEPGSHEFDGTFYFTINKLDFTAKGYWKARSSKIPKQEFKLTKIETNERTKKHIFFEDSITKSNFLDVFYYAYDSLGEFNFNDNGMVNYEYLIVKDSKERKEVLKTVKGSWIFKDQQVLVDWNKNGVFKEKRSVFTFVNDSVQGLFMKLNERKLFPMYY